MNTKTDLLAEASAWLVKVNSGKISQDELFELEEWLSKSEQHKQAFSQVSRTWQAMGQLVPSTTETEGSLPLPRIIHAWAQLNPWKSRYITASLVFVLLFCTWIALMSLPSSHMSYEQMTVRTQIGENKVIPLSDGSTIQLNTDTEVRISFAEDERSVVLTQGEAHFDVAKDKARPFRVYAGKGSIEAVGTAFRVYLKAEGTTEVTVTEGEVKLAHVSNHTTENQSSPTPQETIARVKAGRNALFNESLISVDTISKDDLAKELSWRDGNLLFNGDTLESVLAEFKRYNQTNIVILDKALLDLRIVGYFKAGDMDAFLSTLEKSFHIQASLSDSKVVYLYRTDS